MTALRGKGYANQTHFMKYMSVYKRSVCVYSAVPDTKVFLLFLMKCRTEFNSNEMKFGLPDE